MSRRRTATRAPPAAEGAADNFLLGLQLNLVPRDTNAGSDVLVRDLTRSLTRLVTQDTAGEQAVGTWAGVEAISKDGRYVLFGADAGNLVLDDTNGSPDLFVHDDTVYLKTTRGPQRVDVIYRRLDDDFCDPLELRRNSILGVPGLVEALRSGNVAVANARGCGIMQSPAMPFRNRWGSD